MALNEPGMIDCGYITRTCIAQCIICHVEDVDTLAQRALRRVSPHGWVYGALMLIWLPACIFQHRFLHDNWTI